MMPAPGSEAQSPTRLRATPIGDADFDGLAFFLSGAGLPIGDLKEPGRVFYRVEADNLVGYGGIEGEAERAGVERLHLLTTTAARFFRTQGYADAARASAPAGIASSAEFTRLCQLGRAHG